MAIETKSRELDSRLLVGMHLAAQGFPVLLGSRNAIHRECSFLHGAVYVGKSVNPSNLSFYHGVKKRGGKVVLMDEEGGVYYGDGSDGILSRISMKVVPTIDFYIVFGEAIKKLMIKLLPGIVSEHIHVTGNPRFDLVKERFDDFFAPQVAEIQKAYGPYVLINTNFAMANGFKKGTELIRWIEKHENITPRLKEVMKHHLPLQAELHQKFVALALQLAAHFPQINFVIRPHPSEDERSYEVAFANHKNLFVRKEGNVAFWIRGARAVIHNDCTTAIESKIADKFVLSFCPIEDSDMSVWLPVLASDQKTQDPLVIIRELEKLLLHGEQRWPVPIEKAPRIEEYIANLRAEAYPKVVQAFLAELGDGQAPQNPWRLALKPQFKRALQRARARYHAIRIWLEQRFLGKTNEAADKYRGITRHELELKLAGLSQRVGMTGAFRVRAFAHECFLIESQLKDAGQSY